MGEQQNTLFLNPRCEQTFNCNFSFGTHFLIQESSDRVLCEICKKTISRKADMRYHMFSHFPKEYLTCKDCKKTCTSFKSYKRHLSKCNQSSKNHLSSVSNEAIVKTALKKPRVSTISSKEFLCQICCKSFTTSISLEKHIALHYQNFFQCDLCKKELVSKQGLREHMYTHFPEEFLTCTGCREIFKTVVLFKKHLRDCNVEKKKKRVFKCDVCSKVLYSKSGLRVHVWSHYPEEYLTCNGCKETFSTVTIFRLHKRNCNKYIEKKKFKESQSKKILKCDLCAKILRSKHGLREHIFLHFPEEYCTCTVCKITFKTMRLFKKHLRSCNKIIKSIPVPPNKNPLTCELCQKNLYSKDGLRKHVFTHFPEEYLTCEFCKLTCKTMRLFRKHLTDCKNVEKKTVLKTTKKNALICDLCEKKFFSKRGLRNHIFSHFPQEYCTCTGCNKTFTSENFYSKHLRECSKFNKIKNVKSMFECELCKKSFRHKTGIRNHVFTHFPEEYLTCELCKKSFKSVTSVLKHSRECNKPMKKFKCHICEKILWGYSELSLKGHLTWHSKKKLHGPNCESDLVKKHTRVRKPRKKVLAKPQVKARAPKYTSLGVVKEEVASDLEDNKELIYPLISDIEIKEEVF